jgi:chemotaxis protein methyltransferase CheR
MSSFGVTTPDSSGGRPLLGGVPKPLPDPQLLQVRDLIYQVAGILHPEHRIRFLEERCQKRMQLLGLSRLPEYYDRLTKGAERTSELTSLLNEITIGETCFFRNLPQIDALRKVIFPALSENKKRLPFSKIRIWSAGCSTGEEAHTLAILLLEEKAGIFKGIPFEVIATDLNQHSLEKAHAGIYGDYATRNLTPYFRQKYFDPSGNQLAIKDEVKSVIQFSRLNLRDDARMTFMKSMDIIFCCNVMIYFDAQVRTKVVQHYYSNLLPGSYLFLGHSESLYGINQAFHLVHFPGATAYFKPAAPVSGGAK